MKKKLKTPFEMREYMKNYYQVHKKRLRKRRLEKLSTKEKARGKNRIIEGMKRIRRRQEKPAKEPKKKGRIRVSWVIFGLDIRYMILQVRCA